MSHKPQSKVASYQFWYIIHWNDTCEFPAVSSTLKWMWMIFFPHSLYHIALCYISLYLFFNFLHEVFLAFIYTSLFGHVMWVQPNYWKPILLVKSSHISLSYLYFFNLLSLSPIYLKCFDKIISNFNIK